MIHLFDEPNHYYMHLPSPIALHIYQKILRWHKMTPKNPGQRIRVPEMAFSAQQDTKVIRTPENSCLHRSGFLKVFVMQQRNGWWKTKQTVLQGTENLLQPNHKMSDLIERIDCSYVCFHFEWVTGKWSINLIWSGKYWLPQGYFK